MGTAPSQPQAPQYSFCPTKAQEQQQPEAGPSSESINNADESGHQILSYGLLFSTFYHFPYTTDPPTHTKPTRPFMALKWTFARLSSTIPYTHRTIGPAPHWRSFIWLIDHIVPFFFFSFFSITQCVLSRPGRSQAFAPRGWDLTICFTAHKPCASLFIVCI